MEAGSDLGMGYLAVMEALKEALEVEVVAPDLGPRMSLRSHSGRSERLHRVHWRDR